MSARFPGGGFRARLARSPRALPAALIVLAALSACGPVAGPTNRSTPTTARTPTAFLTPTPSFEGRVLDLAVHTSGRPGDWLVLGMLQNLSDFAVSEIQLLVSLHDPRGQTVAETTALAALPHVGPGELTPFEASFQGVGAVTGADAQVLLAVRTPIQRGEVQVAEPEVFLAEDGSTLLFGTLSNPGTRPLEIHGVLYLGLDAQAVPRALARQLHAPSWLDAGASLPFLARVEGDHRQLRWIAYSDALQASLPLQGAVVLQELPLLQWTDQGRAFAIGELVNTGGQSRNASLLLSVRRGEQVLSLASLAAPFPIGPGERLPFGQAEFPGLSLRLADFDPAELTLEGWVDPRASGPSTDHRIQLEVQIDSLEGVGSAVFLRGSVANPAQISLSRPGLYAALRTTEGQLLTAGWRQLAPRLAAGEQLAFVLDLPFPAGAELSMAEFDVLAFGLGP